MAVHFTFDLKLRGGQMSYMKLIKLLYLADRTSLLHFGKPITMDSWYSMKHGPVLSTVPPVSALAST